MGAQIINDYVRLGLASDEAESEARILALHPMGGRVTVQSDNPAYPDWPDCSLEQIQVIGRVIWSGRRMV